MNVDNQFLLKNVGVSNIPIRANCQILRTGDTETSWLEFIF